MAARAWAFMATDCEPRSLGRVPNDGTRVSTHSFFTGVLIGLATDLPFLINDNAEFELRTLLLGWGVLAMSGVALYVARPLRLRNRRPNKAMDPSQRIKATLRPAKQRPAANETDASSPASHQEN